ncbi:MAG: cytochrome P450 [Acidimicrobiales bacterium]
MVTPVSELVVPELPFVEGQTHEQARADVQRLRAESWIVKGLFGSIITTREDTLAILRDDRWHQAAPLLAQMSGVTDERYLARQKRPNILTAEGDEHQRLRRLVAPAFTPRQADKLRQFMADLASRLVDDIEADAKPGDTITFDAVSDLCEAFPIPIICELLGAPADDWPTFSRWANDIFKIFNADLIHHTDTILAAQEEIDVYIGALIETRRTSPGDDLLSELIAAEEEGDRLSHDELVMLAQAVLLAGTDTTRNQLGCSLALFSNHNDQWRQLASDPATYAPKATEESMRYLGAVRGTGRFASVDIEYNDVLFPAGSIVFPSFVAANTDPSANANPDEFDIDGEGRATHLTLGFGLHYCLGANLARAELQEALTVLSARMPDLAPAGDPVWEPDGVGIWGPAVLPLTYTKP